MSCWFRLNQNLDLSLFVAPVGPQALLWGKDKALGKKERKKKRKKD